MGKWLLATCWLVADWLVLASTALPVLAEEPLPDTVEFNRDIRPILSDTCFQCHGPDKAQRKTELRFDVEQSAYADLGGYRAIVPGDPAASEMVRRITSADESQRMPPPESGRSLTPRQIELLRRWIEQGATWQPHWSLIPPQRPRLPQIDKANWAHNPIDAFVLERLDREGWSAAGGSPEADKTTLIRRVTLDLTGLPPKPADVDAFLADNSPGAYERVVDRLLASPRYGERMAVRWLDAARYADTNGYQTDGERTMWRWRDWVIEAYNRNMPFDQFSIEQLAGDMLPGATLDQVIATGFNRNHRGNAEGGIIPEEYAVEYVVDRVDTTATVWMGLTMGCARCHDHKYDPVMQREFYQVFAYFNNVPERGKAVKYGNSAPMIKAPTRDQQQRLAAIDARLAAAQQEFAALEPQLAAAQAEWEALPASAEPVRWSVSAGLLAHFELDGDTTDQCGPARSGSFQEGEAAYVRGPIGMAAEFDGSRFIDAGDVGHFGFYDKFSCGAWIYLTGDSGAVLSRMTDMDASDGYNLHVEAGHVQANLVKRWLDDAVRVETHERIEPGRWHHVMMTYDGSRWASGVKIYIDGESQPVKILVDELNQTFETKEPLRIGSRGTGSRFQGSIDDVRVYNDCLKPDEVALVATPDAITDLVTVAPRNRTARQANKLRAYFLETHAPEAIRQAHRKVVELGDEREQHVEGFPTTMVMQEMETPRDTFVLQRGVYDKPGEKVMPGVPASLPALGDSLPNNRLGFAQWLVSTGHPLTPRVAVNRFWQMYFGTGLVKTPDDFGSQGEPPSHPELLDWLATEFVESGWDVKAMQRLIVTSATYRQSSKASPELLGRDPDNRLLARGSRLRLSAEMIRDQALAASGLLAETLGGPSVKPYQPDGLWAELSDTEYVQGHGDDLYRRSLYTFWKRTIAPPTMMTFDAAGREACSVRETRTNTPLQALTLMNEITFVESARVLAERVMTEAGATPQERISHAFRLATARQPRPVELEILASAFEHYLAQYQADPQAALKLASAGEYARNEALDCGEVAAYTAVAGLILNLDEVITKE